MNQDYSTGNRIVDEVGRINISGNIIPMVWFQAIRYERLLSVLEIVPIVAAPIYSALCIIAASLLFYRNKLKEPLIKLRVASENMFQKHLNCGIKYKNMRGMI